MKRSSFRFGLSILALLVIFACNLPNNAQPTNEPNAIFTQAASTLSFNLTQSAQAGNNIIPPTLPLPPTSSPTISVIIPPTYPPAPIPCNRAQFVGETYADGSVFVTNTPFTKTWRLKNTGTCTWTTGYSLMFDHGDRMGSPETVPLTPGSIPPGAMMDVSVDLVAPSTPGTYQGDFLLRSPDNVVFGIGANGQGSFWVKIVTVLPTATATSSFTATSTPTATQTFTPTWTPTKTDTPRPAIMIGMTQENQNGAFGYNSTYVNIGQGQSFVVTQRVIIKELSIKVYAIPGTGAAETDTIICHLRDSNLTVLQSSSMPGGIIFSTPSTAITTFTFNIQVDPGNYIFTCYLNNENAAQQHRYIIKYNFIDSSFLDGTRYVSTGGHPEDGNTWQEAQGDLYFQINMEIP